MKKIFLSLTLVMTSIASFGQEYSQDSLFTNFTTDSLVVESYTKKYFNFGFLTGGTIESVANNRQFVHGKLMYGGFIEINNIYGDAIAVCEGNNANRNNSYSYLFHIGYGTQIKNLTITPLIGLELNHSDDNKEKYYFDPGLRIKYNLFSDDEAIYNLSFSYTSTAYYIGIGIAFK